MIKPIDLDRILKLASEATQGVRKVVIPSSRKSYRNGIPIWAKVMVGEDAECTLYSELTGKDVVKNAKFNAAEPHIRQDERENFFKILRSTIGEKVLRNYCPANTILWLQIELKKIDEVKE